jgi:hypothetical protein
VAGHAVAGVDGHRQVTTADRREIEQLLHVDVEELELLQVAGLVGGRGADLEHGSGHFGHRRKPGVETDGTGSCAAHLEAVVARRVVARRHHHAGQVEHAGSAVEQVGRSQPDVDDTGAAAPDPVSDRAGDLR